MSDIRSSVVMHGYDPGGKRETSLFENLQVVFENWKMVVQVVVVFALVAIIYAMLAQPVYRADVMVQVEDPNGRASRDARWNNNSDSGGVFDPAAAASTEGELVKSRSVVEQAVKALHLDVDVQPGYFPVVGRFIARHRGDDGLASPFLGMSSFAWGGENVDVPRFDAPYDKAFKIRVVSGNRYELLNPDGEPFLTGVVGKPASSHWNGKPVTILVSSLVANPGAEFGLRKLQLLEAIDSLRSRLVVEAQGKDAGILTVSLEGDEREIITKTVNQIASIYVDENTDHKRRETQATLAFLNSQLPDLKAKLEAAETEYNSFRNQKGTVDLSDESGLLLRQVVDNDARRTDLEQRRTELSSRFSSNYPAVASINQSLAQLNQQQSELSGKIAALPGTEQAAVRLLRNVRVDTQLYTNMLNKSQELSVVAAGETGNVRVVDWAMTPVKPVKPKKIVIVGLAVIAGLFLGIAAPFTRRWARQAVERSDEVERVLQAPVYSVVPHSPYQAKLDRMLSRGARGNHLLATRAPDDIAVEALRSVQTAFHLNALGAMGNNVILITGPRPEVGKSFLASNLAAVLAAESKRVLLIDADMREGDINRYFGLPTGPGLSDVLSDQVSFDEVVHHDVAPGLSLLVRGSKATRPASLLIHSRFDRFLESVSSRYDLVVIDAPPMLAVSDATLIAGHAGTTLFAVRHGHNTESEIAESVRRLRNANVTLRGVLLNDVPSRRLGYGPYYSR